MSCKDTNGSAKTECTFNRDIDPMCNECIHKKVCRDVNSGKVCSEFIKDNRQCDDCTHKEVCKYKKESHDLIPTCKYYDSLDSKIDSSIQKELTLLNEWANTTATSSDYSIHSICRYCDKGELTEFKDLYKCSITGLLYQGKHKCDYKDNVYIYNLLK